MSEPNDIKVEIPLGEMAAIKRCVLSQDFKDGFEKYLERIDNISISFLRTAETKRDMFRAQGEAARTKKILAFVKHSRIVEIENKKGP